MIDGWLKCDSNVAQQSQEMADLFGEVLALKDVVVG